MDIKLKYNIPPILSYLHHAYPLGIIWDESNDMVKAWFCTNYNYLFSITQGKYFFNFLVNYKDTPFLIINNILEYDLKEKLLVTELSKLIFDFLSSNYYIELLIDKYYLSISSAYQEKHVVHEIFFNGIDKEKKTYNIWTYKNGVYQELVIPFHEIVPFYDSTYYEGTNIIMKLYYRKSGIYTFSKEVFLIQINNYIKSINPYKFIAPFGDYVRYENRAFGLHAFLYLFKEFEANKSNGIDVRYLRVIYEHFASMKMKFKYFKEMKVVFTQQEEMVKFYHLAEIKAKEVLMIGAKFNIKKGYVENIEYYCRIINKLHDLIDEEESILKSFVNSNNGGDMDKLSKVNANRS